MSSLLDRRRLVFTLAAIFALAGFAAWQTMDRREDPRMPAYWGQAVVAFPGADAEMVERLLLEPVEDALAEVDDIKTVASTAFAETAVVAIDLDESTDDTDRAWDEVRRALAEARTEFPAGAGEPWLNAELSTDHDAVVLAVTGSTDPTELLAAARTVREALLGVADVARVKIIGDPGEQVTVELDDAAARRIGLTAPALAAQLGSRTLILPGGTLAHGDRTVRLRPLAEMESVAEIRATQIQLPGGGTVPLGEVARVRFGPREPAAELMRLDGEPAVGLGVVATEKVNAVRFGRAVRAALDRVEPEIAPLGLRVVAFQPERVAERLASLNESLLLGIMIVAGVVILAMGLRLGLVVASVVPLVAFTAFAVFAWGGGELHQISIAAVVLALGMLVDNAIVVAENVQWRLDRGADRRVAARAAVRELAVPLGAATATTVAAFLPMLLASSSTADFTRSIPVVVILTLSISYIYAMAVTPALAELFLKPGSSRATALTDRLSRVFAGLAVRRTRLVVAVVAVLVAATLAASGLVRLQFFPNSDRNQLVVDVRLPEGAHLSATDRAARTLEEALLDRPDVVQVGAFVGRSAPRFYYNISSVPWSPHFAQLMVTTRTTGDVDLVLDWLRTEAPRSLPGIEVIGRKLEQGPPVAAPVEVRVFAEELGSMASAAGAIADILRDTPGTADVRHDLGPGEPTLRIAIDDAAAARHGLTRADVAAAIYGQTRGLPVGELRSGDDPVPIVVRSRAGELLPAEVLEVVDVAAPGGAPVPLAQVARLDADWRPAAIHHRNRSRLATVSSQLAPGATFSDVTDALEARLAGVELPADVRIAFGGEAEGSGEANTAMLATLPIGLLVLLGVLLAEFNSFRRVAIILATVPLAATGVVPGLLLSGEPFGFMSLLGVMALVGIVVNNAIVLIEVVEQRRRDGAEVDEALADAVSQRIRPILLTTATTVSGLLPLALSPSTLWPPLAWAMISGLLASTVLTLVVVPALYRLLCCPRAAAGRQPERLVQRAAAAILGAVLVAAPGTEAATVDLAEAMRLAMARDGARAAEAAADAVAERARAERRSSYLPTLSARADVSDRDRELELVTPIGSFPFGDARTESAAVELRQPLFEPSRLLFGNKAARADAEAARLAAGRTRQELAAEAAGAYLEVLAVDARRRANAAYVRSLAQSLDETWARVEAGRALEADALKIEQALERAELELLGLDEAREVAVAALARAVGSDDPVEPGPAPDWLRRPVPSADDAVARALEARLDLEALDTTAEALEQRRAAVRAEAIPRLDARAAWVWTSGSPYAEDRWVEGSVVLSWVPFAAGTRGPRAAAAAAERDAVEHRASEARRGVTIEVRSALAALATARKGVGVGERGIEQATETLRVERERHAAGRVTTNNLLEAEAGLRSQRTLFEIARLEVVRAWVDLWLATGEDDPGALFETAGVS
ncbi:MAG TPA: efflux RND transporter permease subunit [Candidatus Sulfomarinibacteraceae bacterium]|nr:efflux RND transporter permease subunit [Candidatus Sulfomarinibacteraceae bacterium]